MANGTRARRDRIVNTTLTAMLILGLLVLMTWFVGAIGGELDKGLLLVGFALVIGSTAIRLVR